MIDSRRLWSDGDMRCLIRHMDTGTRRAHFESFTGTAGLCDAAIEAEMDSWPSSRLRALFDGIARSVEAAARETYGLGPDDPIPDFAMGPGPGWAEDLLSPVRLAP